MLHISFVGSYNGSIIDITRKGIHTLHDVALFYIPNLLRVTDT